MDDPIHVVTMEWGKAKCTWDNVRGVLDEIDLWWDEWLEEEVTLRFHTMSEAEFEALPEFGGW